MTNSNSATVEVPVDWSVNPRGYISGGSEDTPVFLEAKKKFNTARTRERHKIKKSSTYGLPEGTSFDEYMKTKETS